MTKSDRLNLKIVDEVLSFDLYDKDSKKLCFRKIHSKLRSLPQELIYEVVNDLEYNLGQKLSLVKNMSKIYYPLEWDDVSEMVASGIISVGSHGCAHIILTRSTPENIRKELFLSKGLIERKTGLRCSSFSYPSGARGEFDHQTKKLLKEYGYSCGLVNVAGINDENSDIFELRRLGVDSREDLILFVMRLSRIIEFFISIKQLILNILVWRKLEK